MYNFIKSGSIILLLFFLFTALFLTFPSCDNGPTEPEIEPGRRDYVWEVDTLKLPYGEFTNLRNAWGANPEEIWATGRGSSIQYRLFKFNGSKWENVDISFPLIDSWGIYGLSKNDIWLCTSQGEIAHYWGKSWNPFGNYSPNGEILRINGFSGNNNNNLYAFGFSDKIDRSSYKASILKYNYKEGTWDFIEIGNIKVGFSSMIYDVNLKVFFLSGYRFEDGMQIIYKFTNNKVEKLYESFEETKVFNMGTSSYFMVGKKILKFNSNKGLYVWKDFSHVQDFAGAICGRNEKDIFTAMFGEGIGHYNGNDFEILYETDLWFLDSVIFENDVFFVCFNPETSVDVIIHGQLK